VATKWKIIVQVWYLFTQLDSRHKWLTTHNNC